MKVIFELIHKNAKLPVYATEGSSGADIFVIDDITIYPFKTELIPTGLKAEIPEGYELQIRPRSGLAIKTDLWLKNSPATIDSDYRQEIKLIVTNVSRIGETITFTKGERIAQIVLCPVVRMDIVNKKVHNTNRGGFGSTGS